MIHPSLANLYSIPYSTPIYKFCFYYLLPTLTHGHPQLHKTPHGKQPLPGAGQPTQASATRPAATTKLNEPLCSGTLQPAKSGLLSKPTTISAEWPHQLSQPRPAALCAQPIPRTEATARLSTCTIWAVCAATSSSASPGHKASPVRDPGSSYIY